jgi:hypothetical protein
MTARSTRLPVQSAQDWHDHRNFGDPLLWNTTSDGDPRRDEVAGEAPGRAY